MHARLRRRWIRQAFDAHGARLLAYLHRMVGADAARDIVQQTFLKLWEIDPPPDADHLAPWLFTVSRRAAIDLRRKESRMHLHHAAIRAVPPPHDAAQTLEIRVEARQLLDRLAALPDAEREVLRLRFEGGLSYREIADVTGKPIGTVGSLMHTGIRALRRAVGEEA